MAEAAINQLLEIQAKTLHEEFQVNGIQEY